VQFQPALAEWIFKTLLRPCTETVERDRKACNAHSRHNTPFRINRRTRQSRFSPVGVLKQRVPFETLLRLLE
jgi:hypothetical protein